MRPRREAAIFPMYYADDSLLFHLFQVINNSVSLSLFFISKPVNFYYLAIHKLPERSQKIVDNDGEYFDDWALFVGLQLKIEFCRKSHELSPTTDNSRLFNHQVISRRTISSLITVVLIVQISGVPNILSYVSDLTSFQGRRIRRDSIAWP